MAEETLRRERARVEALRRLRQAKDKAAGEDVNVGSAVVTAINRYEDEMRADLERYEFIDRIARTFCGEETWDAYSLDEVNGWRRQARVALEAFVEGPR